MWTGPLAADDRKRDRAARRRRRYVIAAMIVLCLPLGLLAWLWVWALHDVTFPPTAQVTSQRVIALEAADGQALLPKGLPQLQPVAVEDMPADVMQAICSARCRWIDPWQRVQRFFRTGLCAGGIGRGAGGE